MNRYTKLFGGMLVFCVLLTVVVYFWMYPEEIPGGLTIFSHPENVG